MQVCERGHFQGDGLRRCREPGAANVAHHSTKSHIDRLFAILEAEWHDDELRKAGNPNPTLTLS
jgi:hypothetical protein